MNFKMLSVKCRPFCLGLNVLKVSCDQFRYELVSFIFFVSFVVTKRNSFCNQGNAARSSSIFVQFGHVTWQLFYRYHTNVSLSHKLAHSCEVNVSMTCFYQYINVSSLKANITTIAAKLILFISILLSYAFFIKDVALKMSLLIRLMTCTKTRLQ